MVVKLARTHVELTCDREISFLCLQRHSGAVTKDVSSVLLPAFCPKISSAGNVKYSWKDPPRAQQFQAGLWKLVEGRSKDYVSNPKAPGPGLGFWLRFV